jgi:hypothetical protein
VGCGSGTGGVQAGSELSEDGRGQAVAAGAKQATVVAGPGLTAKSWLSLVQEGQAGGGFRFNFSQGGNGAV